MPLNCGAGEDSWESLGLQGGPISLSRRKWVPNVDWKDWCWSWNSCTLAPWCKELTHWKRPWCWGRLRAGGEGTTEDEMLGRHHWLSGHEFGWAPGVGDDWATEPNCSSYRMACVPVLSWVCYIRVAVCVGFRTQWKFRASGYVGSKISQRAAVDVMVPETNSNFLFCPPGFLSFGYVCPLFPQIFGSTLRRNVFLLPWGFQSVFKVLMILGLYVVESKLLFSG